MQHYDLAVIGSGPAGQKAAIQAAKLGKKVCVIEKAKVVGGAAVNTGTISSKALREAVLHLTGHSKRSLYGNKHGSKREITISDLAVVSKQVISNEWNVIYDAFDRNNIDLIQGAAHFEGPNLLIVERENANEMITADKFVIAIGTAPAMPSNVPFRDRVIMTSDTVFALDEVPKSMIVVGGGVIGTEYACIFNTLGVRVTLVEGRSQALGFLDQEISDSFHHFMRRAGITLRLGEKVASIEHLEANDEDGTPERVKATLESGKHLYAKTLLYAIGRQGTSDKLGLENVGIEYDKRGRLSVNPYYQTQVDHIYAIGDIIGFPALASTAMEQGRLAACHAFGVATQSMADLYPLGIYAVPEISMVGKTEQQLTEEAVPYEVGVALYEEVTRGQLLGDKNGMLKMIIHEKTHRILGVHCIGSGATELIHIGQAVMAFGGTVEYFLNMVFNYPTLAEAYKIAAYNGLNKLSQTY